MKITSIILLFSLISVASGQSYIWENIGKGSGPGTEQIASFGTDSLNNRIAVMRFNGDSMDWNGTVIKEKTLNYGTNPSQPVLMKTNEKGDIIWVKSFNIIDSCNNFAPTDILVDQAGNSVIYLNFGGKPNMRLVLGSDTLKPAVALATSRIHTLVKYDPDGNVLWHQDFDLSRAFLQWATQDRFGNIFLSGTFVNGVNTLTFDTLTLTNPNPIGFMEAFVVKFNSNGRVLWGNTFGGKTADLIYDIDCDNSGNIYFSGLFASDTVFFGPDTLIHPSGGAVISPQYACIGKFGADGTPLWAKGFETTNIFKNQMRNFKSEKGAQLLSAFGYSKLHNFKVENTPLGKGAILLNYHLNGDLHSAIRFSDTLFGSAYQSDFTDVGTDSLGNLYLAGTFNRDSLLISNGKWEKNFSPGFGTKDIYALKFDTSNNVSLLFHIGGDDDDVLDKINVSPGGSLIVTANYKSNSFYLDTIELTNSAFPNKDMFMASFGPSSNNNSLFKFTTPAFLNIYPNPANEILHITASNAMDRIILMTTMGATVAEIPADGEKNISMDITGLQNGMYFLRAEGKTGVYTATLMKN